MKRLWLHKGEKIQILIYPEYDALAVFGLPVILFYRDDNAARFIDAYAQALFQTKTVDGADRLISDTLTRSASMLA